MSHSSSAINSGEKRANDLTHNMSRKHIIAITIAKMFHTIDIQLNIGVVTNDDIHTISLIKCLRDNNSHKMKSSVYPAQGQEAIDRPPWAFRFPLSAY